MQRKGFRAHFIVNVGGAIATLVVMLVTVPLFVGEIGPARYGVMSIIWILLGTMGFLDLGLSRAATNALARIDPSDKRERESIFVTALGLNGVMGLLGGIVLVTGGIALFSHVMTVPPQLLPEVRWALPWVAGLLPLALMNGAGIGSLESRDHFLTANLLQLTGTVAIQTVPLLCAVFIAPRLEVVIPAAVCARGASVVLVIAFAWRSERSGSLPRLNGGRAKEMLRYGGWVSIGNTLNPLLTSLDQMVLGAVMGVASVTYYAVPFSLVMKSQIFAAAASRTLFPRMSRVSEPEAQRLARAAVGGLSYGYGAICVAAILMMHPFISFWMGPDFARVAAPLAQILLVGAWFNGLSFIPFELVQAQGRPHLPALLYLLELGPFFALLWFLTHRFGLTGAALAWALRMALDSLLFFLVSRHAGGALLRLVPMALILAAVVLVTRSIPLGLAASVIAASVGGALTLALGFMLDDTIRMMVLEAWKTARRLARRSGLQVG
ncbi:flippase [Novosphingobium soli]|uniref:Flippase n=1 Tax=Novosphingobium soli TaxID=574956 RepID=A0ABV6CWI4_9SPHN